MSSPFDAGYGNEPFRSLVEQSPNESVYSSDAFRFEWGPIFHRGRLDGSARILLIGQDPSHNEAVVRRILVGEAGRRTQGFLAKLGFDRSYVMINTFLYSVYGQQGGEKHRNDPAIAAYRNRWIDALVDNSKIEAIIALGSLADSAYQGWKSTPKGKKAAAIRYARITHPTQPDSSAKGDATKRKAAMKAMLQNWNQALVSLHAWIAHPDAAISLVLYGDDFLDAERPFIPSFDFPPGLPDWMRNTDGWAARVGATAQQKRANITITVPASAFALAPPPAHMAKASGRAALEARIGLLPDRPDPGSPSVSLSDFEDIPEPRLTRLITPPAGSKTILAGRIVCMDANFTVIKKGNIYIQEGTIVAVKDALAARPAGFASVPVNDTKGTIYPGLIELHNHLSYNALRLWQVPRKYSNRDKWSKQEGQYKQLISGPMAVLGADHDLLPALVRYVECKCLMAGVTTSQGIALSSNNGVRTFYRGVIRTVEHPEDPKLPAAGTRIPDVTATLRENFLAELKKKTCFLLHLSEGTDQKARDHFLALKFDDGSWAITPSLAGIHCVALTGADFAVLKANGASMVWSPMSNLLLYGATADVKAAKAAGLTIAIGSDWSPSGSKNLLGELKVADIYSKHEQNLFTEQELVAMATQNPATILRWDRYLGSLEEGKFADLLVVAGTTGDPYRTLLKATEQTIRLVMIRGVPQYGESSLMQSLDSADGETVKVGSTDFILHLADTDPHVPAIPLLQARQRLANALGNLGTVAHGVDLHMQAMRSAAAMGKSVPVTWTLALDELEDTHLEMRPRLPLRSELTGAARPITTALPAKLLPLQLDPLTVIDDADFLGVVAKEQNLPSYLAQELKKMYGK